MLQQRTQNPQSCQSSIAESPNMRRAALWYAKRGWAVFPLHEPLFDHPQGYTCTCEGWRHSNDCQAKRPDLYLAPDQHCAQPGKHPRGVASWQAAATTDAITIATWWTKYPTANIGIDCGRSGLLVLDVDLYKQTHLPPTILTEQRTTTVLTGNGGLHLIYQMPPAQRYGNAKGQLAPGIDVRGVGGYIVAAPSLHASGKRYRYETDHNPAQLAPQPLPDAIKAMLDESKPTHSQPLPAFTPRPLAKPSLDQWRLSARIRQAIHQPAPQGQRSEADQAVMLALVAQGGNRCRNSRGLYALSDWREVSRRG